jgi:hypothetical protein
MSVNSTGAPRDEEILFASLAKVRGGSWSAPEGLLALTQELRLVFLRGESVLDDWPVGEVANLQSPWYVVGQGFRFTSRGQRDWVSFTNLSSMARTGMLLRGAGLAGAVAGLAGTFRLAMAGAKMMEISSARGLCSEWKAMIAAAQAPHAPSA